MNSCGFRGPFVEEEMAAIFEPARAGAGDARREQPRVLDGCDRVLRTVHHQGRRAHLGKAGSDVRSCGECGELCGEHAGANRMCPSPADLLLYEVAVRALELRRVQHRAGHPVRLFGRARPLSEQRVGGVRVGGHRLHSPGRRGGQYETRHPIRVLQHEVLRNHPAHRRAHDVCAAQPSPVEHRSDVRDHQVHRQLGRADSDAPTLRGSYTTVR